MFTPNHRQIKMLRFLYEENNKFKQFSICFHGRRDNKLFHALENEKWIYFSHSSEVNNPTLKLSPEASSFLNDRRRDNYKFIPSLVISIIALIVAIGSFVLSLIALIR